MATTTRRFRPMQAMNLNWHLNKALEEFEFSEVSDKLRNQLVEGGMPPREAAIKAPIILDGTDKALRGDFDFKRIRSELCAERRSPDPASPLMPAAAKG